MASGGFRQDLPPPGGYPPIRIDLSAPKKGFSNITTLLIITGLMTYGWAKYIINTRAINAELEPIARRNSLRNVAMKKIGKESAREEDEAWERHVEQLVEKRRLKYEKRNKKPEGSEEEKEE